MTDQQTPSPEPSTSTAGRGGSGITIQFNPQQLLFVSLALLGLLLICLFGFLLVDPFNWLSEEDEAVVTEPEEEAVDGGDGALTEDVIVVFDGVGTLSIDLDPPLSMRIRNRDYPIQTEFVSQDGNWVGEESGEIEWVFGSIINQVYGFPTAIENELLLEQIVPGERVEINYQSGDSKTFVVTGRELSDVSNRDLFVQSRPGLKLVWLGEKGEGTRLIVSGDFALPEGAADPGSDLSTVSVGETVQLFDLRLTVNDSTVVTNDPNTPPGFSLFLVNYEIENIGQQPIDSGLLRLTLADDNGNQYSLNPIASQGAANPLLTGVLEPEFSRSASAGYQIPSNLVSEQLTWSVSRSDSPGRIEVNIPYAGQRLDSAGVTVSNAEVSLDGTSLLVSGTIENRGEFPLVVTESDLMLESGSTNYLIFSTTPGFPWTVAPGQSLPFALSFQRPQTAEATFTILGKGFLLNGLR